MKIDISKEWLKASMDDLKLISKIIDLADLSHMVAFHAQQSVEKSLKALIEYKQLKVPRQHDLLKLQEMTREYLKLNNDDLLDTLNEIYINSRYPSEFGLLPCGKPTLEDAKVFYDFAMMVFDKVCDLLGVNKESLK